MTERTSLNQIIEEFIKINHLMTYIQKKPVQITDNLKLSTSMIHLIDIIGKYPNIHVTEISDRLGVTKGAVSQQISTLKKTFFDNH